MRRGEESPATLSDSSEDFISGDAVDSRVHEAVDDVLGDGASGGSGGSEFGNDASADGDGEALALFDFAEDFGEFGFGFEGADGGGHGWLLF